jgi:DNA repair exonuclease SbcCD ATPase subunit
VILRRLRVQRFLGLTDQTFEFAPGINVIVGPNEAGKSTLRRAIRTALYGNPAGTSAKSRDELRSWGEAEASELYLEFEIDGRGFALFKDYGARKIVLSGGGRTWDSHKLVQERLVDVLGLPTVELFEATAQVAQAELERIHLTSIAKELSRIVGGGGEDVSTSIRRLDQRIREMERGSRGMAKDPGVLKTLETRAAAFRTQVQHLTAAAAEAERKQRELVQIRAQLAEREGEFEAKRALLEMNRQILQDVERLEGLRQQETMLAEKISQIEQTQATLTDLDRKLEAATSEGMPDEAATRSARSLSDRMAMREQEAADLRGDLDEATSAAPAGRSWLLFLVTGIVVALTGVVLSITTTTPGWWLVLAGAIIAAAGGWRRSRTVEAERRHAARRQEKQARLVDLEAAVAQDQQHLSEHLAWLRAKSLDEAEQHVRNYQDLVRARAASTDLLTAVRAGGSDEVLRERWNKVRLDIFGIEERLRAPEKAGRRLTPLEVQSLDVHVARLAEDVKKAADRERRLTVELEHLRGDAEMLAELEEQLQETEDALLVARRQHAVYAAALNGLIEARRQAEIPVREVVGGKASEYLSILSEGRYARLQVEKDSLQVKIWSNAAGDWVLPEEPHLSRGTVDLVYLSARLALVDVLAEGKHPPLLLDDPFVTFDEHRRAAAARLLRELSQTHQIFLFTSTRHFDEGADRVIELSMRGVEAGTLEEPTRTRAPVEARPVGPLWDPSA